MDALRDYLAVQACVWKLLRRWIWSVGLLLYASAPLPVAETFRPPALLLAETYRDSIDPAGYWVSEKLDGIRAYWDGQQLWSRSGQPIRPPAWFVKEFPRQALDGELWLGRGQFERLSGMVRKTAPVDEEWRRVSYQLFELPGASGTFTQRLDQLQHLVETAHVPWLTAVEQFRVMSRALLHARLNAVVAEGGEGLMLHRADAAYVTGRSEDLLKFKPHLDREARVVAYLPGKGKHAGRMGALLVNDDGREFRLGTGFTDAQRENPPPISCLVTYRYQGLTAKGLPRFPVFLRMRDEP